MKRIDRITKIIDAISVWSGKATSWLIFPMIFVLAYEVLIRHIGRPTLWATDMGTIFYGLHYWLAGAFTLYAGKHIRTDFFYANWSLKTQCWVDLICYIFLFLPGMVMFIILSWEFAAESWALKEKLMTTWRPAAYWFKSAIPLGGILLLIQGFSEILKSIKSLKTGVDHRVHAEASEIT